MKRTLARVRCTAVKAVIRFLLDLVDRLMPLAGGDGSSDTGAIITTASTAEAAPIAISRADVEAVLTTIRIEDSCASAGFPRETAAALIARGVTDASVVERLLCDVSQRIQ